MVAYKSYIICTSPRSGSTLLCRLLAATGVCGLPDSHFHRPSVADWIRYYAISDADYAEERELLSAIFQAARDRGTASSSVFGLRMQSDSFNFFLRKLKVLRSGCSVRTDADRIQEEFGDTLFIHLTRPNKLDQAISLEKAVQTGLWHQASDGTELERTTAPRTPVFDTDAIARHLIKLSASEAQWYYWFTEQGIQPLRISYCDLSADPQKILAAVLHRLGLDSSIAADIPVPVAKLADEINETWAKRFIADERSL